MKIKLGLGLGNANGFVLGLPHQPEVQKYMNKLGISHSNTVYFTGTPQENTGQDIWDAYDAYVTGTKSLYGLQFDVMSLENKFGFLYPFYGDNATMCKYNLANADNFAGTFNGGFTFDSSGVTGNGTNAYFNTTASQSTMAPVVAGSESYGVLSKTNASGTYCDLASIDNTAGAQHEVYMNPRSGSNLFVSRLGSNGVNNTFANTDSSGFISMSRTNTSDYKIFRNGSALTTHTQASNNGNNVDPVFIWANGVDSVPSQYSIRKLTLAYASSGISDADMATFYTLTNTLQTALGR